MDSRSFVSKSSVVAGVVAFGLIAGCKAPTVTLSADTTSINAGQPVALTINIQSEMAKLGSVYNSPVWRVKKDYVLKATGPVETSTDLNPSSCIEGVIYNWDCVVAPFAKSVTVYPPRTTTYTVEAKEVLSMLFTKDVNTQKTTKTVTVQVNRDVTFASILNATLFPDAKFRTCVQDTVTTLGLTNVSQLTDLTCTGNPTASITTRVRNIAGIQYLYNLQNVNLAGSYLGDELAYLFELENLVTLNVSGTAGTTNNGGLGTCSHEEDVYNFFNGTGVTVTYSAHCAGTF